MPIMNTDMDTLQINKELRQLDRLSSANDPEQTVNYNVSLPELIQDSDAEDDFDDDAMEESVPDENASLKHDRLHYLSDSIGPNQRSYRTMRPI